MTRRFIRKTNPNIKELVEEEQCGCGNRILPYLMKSAVTPCTETSSQKGVNLVPDPSFEQSYAGGPNNETFPGEIGAGQGPWELSWADSSAAPYSPWAVFTNDAGGSANMWHISTTNPRTGSQHARFGPWDQAEFGESDSDLMPLLVEVCDKSVINGWPSYNAWMSAIISPGDLIDASIWAARQTTETYDMNVYVEIWNQDWSTLILENGNYSQPLSNGGTYQQFSYQVVAPAGSYWLQAFYVFSRASGNFPTAGDIFDMDDASLIIT